MFERFLGSKLEHSDPLVRAKAYATEPVDEDTLSAALVSENAPQVLLEIVGKSLDARAILGHTNSSSTIAGAARSRLASLANEPLDIGDVVWSQVYERAITEQWAELPQFAECIQSGAGFEHVAQGALIACGSFAPTLLPTALLQDLVCSCQSSSVRQAAAQLITDPIALENCCREVKDKDKTVYRDIRTRLDQHKEREQLRELALALKSVCDELPELGIAVQPESIAIATAKLQKLEGQIHEISTTGEELAEVADLNRHFASVSPEINARIAAAREALATRRQLTATLEQLADTAAVSTSADEALREIRRLRDLWKDIPDNGEIESRRFSEKADAVAAALITRQRNIGVSDELSNQLEAWEKNTAPRDPEKALLHIESKWESFEKPQDDVLLAPLKHRYVLICESLQIKVQQHQLTRAQNSKTLLELLNEFKTSIGNGDLKVATSCQAKLKHRLNTELLDAGVRKKAETDLRQAQPQLDEYRNWRHFGTIQARDNLIGEANKLLVDPPASPVKLADQIKNLRESWKKLDQGDGRSSSDQWETFRKLLNEAYKPAKIHFKKQLKERKSNEKVKREIIRTLEELHANTDWQNPDWSSVCETSKEARQQWLKTGVVNSKVRKELEKAYAQATQNLEAAMQDERDREVRRRQLLISQLQKEIADGDTRTVADTAKRMQRNWRPTVQTDRKTEQQLWKEFRTACDAVFTQLKDEAQAEKTAWQAEADERRKACDAVADLLKDLQQADERTLNHAKGQADELRKKWGQKSTIPKAVLHKLERRFNDAMKAYQQRARQIRRQHEQRNQENLEKMAVLCQQAEQLALEPETDPERRAGLHNEWSALTQSTDGPAVKALTVRLERALGAMDGNQEQRAEIEQTFEKNLHERRYLCLMGELIAELPSPAEYAGERMQLQVKRLKTALQGGVGEKRQELEELIQQWFVLGGVGAEHWEQLHERFSRIRDAAAGL